MGASRWVGTSPWVLLVRFSSPKVHLQAATGPVSRMNEQEMLVLLFTPISPLRRETPLGPETRGAFYFA